MPPLPHLRSAKNRPQLKVVLSVVQVKVHQADDAEVGTDKSGLTEHGPDGEEEKEVKEENGQQS